MKDKFKFIAVEPLSKKPLKPQAIKASNQAVQREVVWSEAHRREEAFESAVKYTLWATMIIFIACSILYLVKQLH